MVSQAHFMSGLLDLEQSFSGAKFKQYETQIPHIWFCSQTLIHQSLGANVGVEETSCFFDFYWVYWWDLAAALNYKTNYEINQYCLWPQIPVYHCPSFNLPLTFQVMDVVQSRIYVIYLLNNILLAFNFINLDFTRFFIIQKIPQAPTLHVLFD